MTWDQKKIYITSLVKRELKKSTKKRTEEVSRRQGTINYSIRKANGEYVKVCKKMFLNTFGLGEWTVSNWIGDVPNDGIHPSREADIATRPTRKNEIFFASREILLCFLDSLPKLPSHYCRKDSKKIYVEPIWGNKMSLVYNEYLKLCEVDNIAPISRFSFDKVIKEKNLSFQRPKKDRCDTCISFELKHIDENKYNDHIGKKERARLEKNNDKKAGQEGKTVVLTQDVMAVQVSPFTNASALYYKRKLCCHNFTVYDASSHDAVNYWFNETEADLSANTFASCIVDYLTENTDSSKPIIIWSDGCTYQNRNAIFANALLAFAQEKNVVVEQKFLLKGHTQMEVDTVHAVIKNQLDDVKIYLPSDYMRETEKARKKPRPYRAKEFDFNFIKNYSDKDLMIFDSIRPGKKPGDPVVTDIVAIKYLPEGEILTKIGSFDAQYEAIPQRRRRNKVSLSSFKQLHSAPLKLPYAKWLDLQELKHIVPKDAQVFYEQLPHFDE